MKLTLPFYSLKVVDDRLIFSGTPVARKDDSCFVSIPKWEERKPLKQSRSSKLVGEWLRFFLVFNLSLFVSDQNSNNLVSFWYFFKHIRTINTILIGFLICARNIGKLLHQPQKTVFHFADRKQSYCCVIGFWDWFWKCRKPSWWW